MRARAPRTNRRRRFGFAAGCWAALFFALTPIWIAVNRTNVTDLKSFTEAVAKLRAGDAVVLYVISYDIRVRSPQLKIVQFTVK